MKPHTIIAAGVTLAATVLFAGTPIANLILTGNMDAGGFRITNLGAPTGSADAATKGYTDTGLAGKVSLSGSYSDPVWLTSLAWSKLTSKPAIITNFAGLTTAANKGLYFSALDSPATFDLTAAGRALLDDATPADQRTTMGLGDSATKNIGTTSGTVAAGDDSRIVNAVQTTGSYSNPAWITAVAWTKISGAPAFLLANQTITLTGAVTGSGTTSIATTLSADQARANLTGGSGTLNLASYTLALPTVPITQGGTGATTAAAAFANLKQPASTSATGVVQIATDGEVQTGTDSLKAVVSSSLAAWWTWIKTQAMTLSGQPAATASAAGTVITRDNMVPERFWANVYDAYVPNSTSTSGTGFSISTAAAGFSRQIEMVSAGGSLVNGNYGRAVYSLSGPFTDSVASGNISLQRSFWVFFDLNGIYRAGGNWSVQIGVSSTPTPGLAARGLQLIWEANTLKVGIHNGTDLLESSGATYSLLGGLIRGRIALRWDATTNTLTAYGTTASTNVSLGRMTQLATVTRDPGATTASGNCLAFFHAITDAATVNSSGGTIISIAQIRVYMP